MTPTEALEHEEELLQMQADRMKKQTKGKKVKPKFAIGDNVRISRVKDKFEKGFVPNWSREVYQIVDFDQRYTLQNELGEIVEGSFYEPELQKTSIGSTREVEKIIRKREVDGKTQYLVKYLGYSDKHNAWIEAEDFDPDFFKQPTPNEGENIIGYKSGTQVRKRKKTTRKRAQAKENIIGYNKEGTEIRTKRKTTRRRKRVVA